MKAFYSVVTGIVVNSETHTVILYETYDLNDAIRKARHEFTDTCQKIIAGRKTICIINNLTQTTMLEIKFNM